MQKSEPTINKYVKYSGTGNTFVLLDNRQLKMTDLPSTAKDLCGKFQVDGLLVMEDSDSTAIRMRIMNPDGSEAEMCGNGSRCAAHWAYNELKLSDNFSMESGAGVLEAKVCDDTVKVKLTDPKDCREIKDLQLDISFNKIFYINTGVPHVVIETDEIEEINVDKIGATVRYHEMFKPNGANASFYKKNEGANIRCRVYERGVESETQACGTGSTACALVAARSYGLTSPVKVTVESKEELNIYFEETETGFSNVCLEGAVRIIENGDIEL